MSQKAAAKGGSSKSILALCTYCGKDINIPELKVMIGKRLKSIKGSYQEENTIFLSAEDLHKWIEMLFLESDEMKLDMYNLRISNK